MNYPEEAGVYGCEAVLGEQSGVWLPVGPADRVFPVFSGLAMGWKWALHLCQEMSEFQTARAAPTMALLRD
eukprot:4797694-Lingulodinium_polyedra.AAC.1